MDLSTVARVKALISSNGTAPANADTEIAAVLTTVSAAVESYIDRYGERVSRTEYFDVRPGQLVFRLRGYPVTAVTGVYFDTEQAFGAGTEVDSDSYWNPTLDSSGTLELKWPVTQSMARRSLKVTYTGGLGTTASNVASSYPDIAGAVDVQTAHEWQRRNAMGTTSVSYPDGTSASINFDRWIPSVKQVLDSYRRLCV